MHYIDLHVSGIHASSLCVWAPPLTKVLCYSASNTVMQLNTWSEKCVCVCPNISICKQAVLVSSKQLNQYIGISTYCPSTKTRSWWLNECLTKWLFNSSTCIFRACSWDWYEVSCLCNSPIRLSLASLSCLHWVLQCEIHSTLHNENKGLLSPTVHFYVSIYIHNAYTQCKFLWFLISRLPCKWKMNQSINWWCH